MPTALDVSSCGYDRGGTSSNENLTLSLSSPVQIVQKHATANGDCRAFAIIADVEIIMEGDVLEEMG